MTPPVTPARALHDPVSLYRAERAKRAARPNPVAAILSEARAQLATAEASRRVARTTGRPRGRGITVDPARVPVPVATPVLAVCACGAEYPRQRELQRVCPRCAEQSWRERQYTTRRAARAAARAATGTGACEVCGGPTYRITQGRNVPPPVRCDAHLRTRQDRADRRKAYERAGLPVPAVLAPRDRWPERAA